VREQIGIGDGVQFSSVPENYFHATGNMLTVESRNWFYDHNPYVSRTAVPIDGRILLWERLTQDAMPDPLSGDTYSCNAEIHCAMIGLEKISLKRPRLYRYENLHQCERIVFHPHGISQGTMPKQVVDHVIAKYGDRLVQIGKEHETQFISDCYYPADMWDLARFIAQSSGFIGMSSGPSWIAACYPKVWNKVVRYSRPDPKRIPLSNKNLDSLWDDVTIFDFYNATENDVGFTKGFRGI